MHVEVAACLRLPWYYNECRIQANASYEGRERPLELSNYIYLAF